MTDSIPLPDLLRTHDDFDAVECFARADDETRSRWQGEAWGLEPAELTRWIRIQRRARQSWNVTA